MITILLVNLIGVAIYVKGVSLCLRTTKRTGNNGYLLLAGYFAAVLVVSSVTQIARMQDGPAAPEQVRAEEALPQAKDADAVAEAAPAAEEGKPDGEAAGSPVAEENREPEVIDDSPWEQVSLPILPGLLLWGVFLISRDDPRRRKEEAEEAEEAAETAETTDDPSTDGEDEVKEG